MTIRNMDKFVASLWDWGFLDGCFGNSRSHVGDIDGIIEQAGEVLMLEGKPFDGTLGWRHLAGIQVPMERAARLWKGLAGRGISILVLWGEPIDQNDPMYKMPYCMQLWLRYEGEPYPVQNALIDLVRERVSNWWNWAERCSKDRP